ncbi:ribose-phosphate pyrophosphokinase, partial [Campylobacter jejuni]|nr:ribose-phosphate pyrophosphokinase [Campylobacter jejuni]
LDELVVTDTIPLKEQLPNIKVLSVTPVFAEVIRRVYHNESVNSLFI